MSKQLEEGLPDISNYENTLIAYEPIWAIGTGLTPTLEDIQEVHEFIKQIDKKENFRRIIDLKNNSGWIHVSQLKKVNSIISKTDKILFNKPTNFSKPLAKIKKGTPIKVEGGKSYKFKKTKDIDMLEKTEIEEFKYYSVDEKFRYFLLPAIILIVFEIIMKLTLLRSFI